MSAKPAVRYWPNGDSSIVSAQTEIFNNFQSYAEISPSGQGLHIIVIGDVPRGRRRNKIEVYSKGRYFNMTGNVYRKSPIIACQAELTRLYLVDREKRFGRTAAAYILTNVDLLKAK